MKYGEYRGVSLCSLKEIYHSEFFKHLEKENYQEMRKKLIVPLFQRYKDKRSGYLYNPESEVIDPYKFREIKMFYDNRILSIRHELNMQAITFQNFAIQFLYGILTCTPDDCKIQYV
jgi:hypothetical protein